MSKNSARVTHSYKTVGSCNLRLDIYRFADKGPQPAIVWLHGGGLITGSRRMLPAKQALTYLNGGFVLVSVDYRLAPETKVRDILNDVVGAYDWILERCEIIGIEDDRIALVGHSAGAYLALLAAVRVSPKPKAVVSFYGYGDISGEWANNPSPYYCQQGLLTREEAQMSIGKKPISSSSTRSRFKFYIYCRQQGIWGREIIGDDLDNLQNLRSLYCPVFSITSSYPPAMLLHGDQDVDVPVSQTLFLGKKLSSVGVPCQQIILHGYGHAFDVERKGLNDPVVSRAFDAVIDFLIQNV